jgi:hypothetical protein
MSTINTALAKFGLIAQQATERAHLTIVHDRHQHIALDGELNISYDAVILPDEYCSL